MKPIFFSVLCFLCIQSNVFSQTIIGRQQAIVVKTSPWPSGVANALLWLPDDYKTTSYNYPLLIHLHGIGETGITVGDLNKLLHNSIPQRIANGWNPEAINPKTGKLTKFIVVSPQSAVWSMQASQLKYILPDLIKHYRINPKRVYIGGMSAGGSGAWTCITDDTAFCKQIAAVAPMSAAPVNLANKVTNAAKYGVAVWDIIQQYDNDGFTPYNIDYVKAINNAFPIIPAKITIIPGSGHSACNQGYDPAWYDPNDPQKLNLYQWLLQYKVKTPAAAPPVAEKNPANSCNGKRIYLNKAFDGRIIIDGNTFKYSPGDTLVLQAKNNPYSIFNIFRIHGTSQCPVVIINEGGQLKFTRPGTAITISNSTHIKLLGNGSSKDLYGFEIYNSPDSASGVGIQVDQRSADVEISNAYIHNKSFAFWVKQEQSCPDSLQYPNWVIDSIFIHDNLCRKFNLEGMYLGSTDPNGTDRFIICNGDTVRPKPLRLGDIYVYNNIMDSTGRSGIQLSGASTGVNKIYNNTVTNCGFEFNTYGQGAGIAIGTYTHARIYNNTIKNTLTNGIACFGTGKISIHDNKIDSSGILSGRVASLVGSIMIDTRPTIPADSTNFFVRNNRLGFNTDFGVRVYKTYSTYSTGNIVCGNTGTVWVAPGIDWIKTCNTKPVEYAPIAALQEKSQTNKPVIYVYPNPASNTLFVNIGSNMTGKLLLNIYDAQQKLVQSKIIYKNSSSTIESLNIKSFSPGFYVLQISNEYERTFIKFIKAN